MTAQASKRWSQPRPVVVIATTRPIPSNYSGTWELGKPMGLWKTVLNSEVVLFLRSISVYWIDLGTEVAVLNSQDVPISQVVLKTGFTVSKWGLGKAWWLGHHISTMGPWVRVMCESTQVYMVFLIPDLQGTNVNLRIPSKSFPTKLVPLEIWTTLPLGINWSWSYLAYCQVDLQGPFTC